MFTVLYDWMYQITFYLVIFTAALQLLPSGNYIKYVKFFVGLVLILLVLSPVMKLLGTGDLSQIISEKEQEVADFEETLNRNDSMKLWNIEEQAPGADSSVTNQNTEDFNNAENRKSATDETKLRDGTENNRTSGDGTANNGTVDEETAVDGKAETVKGGQNTENGQKQIFVEPVRVE